MRNTLVKGWDLVLGSTVPSHGAPGNKQLCGGNGHSSPKHKETVIISTSSRKMRKLNIDDSDTDRGGYTANRPANQNKLSQYCGL